MALLALLCALSMMPMTIASQTLALKSPDGRVSFTLNVGEGDHLTYEVKEQDKVVIETSPLGIVVDGVDLGAGVTLGKVERYRINEKYPWRGVHSTATNHCNGARISLKHAKTGRALTLEARVFNDGVGFRFHVAAIDSPQVPDAGTTFGLPAGSIVWYHDFHGHYEGVHVRKSIESVESASGLHRHLRYSFRTARVMQPSPKQR